MPGSVSDSYDPEWGVGDTAEKIETALQDVYSKVSNILKNKPPIYIGDLIDADLPKKITATLTEKEWRLLRFACERAKGSI